VRPPAAASAHASHFIGARELRVVPGAGHNLPQEKPEVFAQAVMQLVRGV
jgi:pimeloyl-ACP methyl ester carboxylesterase